MVRKYFSDREIKVLSRNVFILKISKSSITYSDEFKKIFIGDYLNGKLPRIIFEENGFDSEVLGKQRIRSAAKRWKSDYKNGGYPGLKDTRKTKSGRPLKRLLTSSEKIERMKAKIILLEAENELLKKLKMMERGGF